MRFPDAGKCIMEKDVAIHIVKVVAELYKKYQNKFEHFYFLSISKICINGIRKTVILSSRDNVALFSFGRALLLFLFVTL